MGNPLGYFTFFKTVSVQLILNAVGIGGEIFRQGKGLAFQDLLLANGALFSRQGELFEDKAVVKADTGGVLNAEAEVNCPDSGPVDGSKAHGAGFTGGENLAAAQIKGAEAFAGIANGADFPMSRGVVGCNDTIPALAHNLVVFDDNGAERSPVACFDAQAGQFNRTPHMGKFLVVLGCHGSLLLILVA